MKKTTDWFFSVLVAVLTLSLVASATSPPGSEWVRPIVNHIRNGIPPDRQSFEKRYLQYRSLVDQFFSESQRSQRRLDRNCRRFLDLFKKIHLQLLEIQKQTVNRQTAALSPDNILEVSRLQVLSTLAMAFGAQIQNDSEAGFGILDTERKGRCQVPHRQEWKATALELNAAMKKTNQAVYGTIGISNMKIVDALLDQKIQDNEQADQKKYWTTIAVESVASLLSWYFIPKIVLRFSGPFHEFAQGWPLFGLRVTALTSEALLFQYIEQKLLFYEDTLLRDRRPLISWEDFLSSSEAIFYSEFNSPRLYSDLLAQSYGILSHMMEDFLSSWPETITADLQRDFDLQKLFVGRSRMGVNEILIMKIAEEMQYDVICEGGWIRGISEWDCGMALKKFLRGFDQRQIPENHGDFPMTKVTMGTRWQVVMKNELIFEVGIPFNATIEDMGRYLRFQFDRVSRRLLEPRSPALQSTKMK